MNNNKKIFICCTEQSGENIVFNICQKLKKYNYQIDGVCGKSSEAYFTNKYYDISLFKSLGLVEILFSIPKFIKIINTLSNKILINNYDLIICVDSPDFNYEGLYLEKDRCLIIDKEKTIDLANQYKIFISTCNKIE